HGESETAEEVDEFVGRLRQGVAMPEPRADAGKGDVQSARARKAGGGPQSAVPGGLVRGLEGLLDRVEPLPITAPGCRLQRLEPLLGRLQLATLEPEVLDPYGLDRGRIAGPPERLQARRLEGIKIGQGYREGVGGGAHLRVRLGSGGLDL